MVKWTQAQKNVIGATDKSLLVSASAGAGKTSVLIERIASMLENGVPWEEILVMTFTVESARDMKEKLYARLGAKYQGIVNQISVGTFHKFCGDLVQTYFALQGINPSFAILDDGNATVMQNLILDTLTEEMTDKCPSAIEAFCTVYGNAGLKEVILNVADFLGWQPDGWLEAHAFAGYESDLSKNIAMKLIIKNANEAGEHYTSKFPPDLDCAVWAGKLLAAKSYDDLHNIATSFDKLKPMKKESEYYTAKDQLNDLLKKVREQYILPLATVTKNQDADSELVRQVIGLLQEYLTRYEVSKKEKNFLDFTDLEKHATQILTNPEIRNRIQSKYKYVFVDEYQDTNPVQERILNLLSGDATQVFTVGDLKQSIYAFRGTSASVFTERLRNGKVQYLNENFRSDGGILKFVNDVFSKIMRDGTAGLDYAGTSSFKIDKHTNTDNVETTVIDGGSHEHESAYIASKIAQLLGTGVAPSDIAILARSRTHFDVLQKTLGDAGIQYTTTREVPAESLFEVALLNNMLLSAFDMEYDLPKFLLEESFVFDMKEFNIEKYHGLCMTHKVADVLTTFIAEYDIINRLLVTPNGEARVQNIYTFLNKIRFATYADTVAQYVYMLLNNQLDIKIATSGGTDCVKIMTIHAAKGLEFPIVFLYNTGATFSAEDKRKSLMLDKDCGMCVYSTNPDDNKKHMSLARLGSSIALQHNQIAEEMRLLYVALTRAKERLIIVGSGRIYDNSHLSDYEILNSKNYFDFIRPADSISTEDIPTIKPLEQHVLTVPADPGTVKELKDNFTQVENYAHKTAVDMAQKTSVTTLTKSEEDFADEPLRPSPHNRDRGTEYGTKFHLAMQTGHYFDPATKTCAQVMDEFTNGMRVAREIVLYENVAVNGEMVLVQGVIDLLAIGADRAVIIDYKTTRAHESKLIELYKPQLDMYARAVASATGLRTESYIYSTNLEKLIKV
ncbi:MAG: UvrD-helicase domain-containing protein [Christensenellaceae bacterium]|jgi:ATP-dependent helicase/nuclease subunit A|nr:UvrD-helicase domain-containing protein [Christensenellaceae bacterium]